jgi:hypothetical protein
MVAGEPVEWHVREVGLDVPAHVALVVVVRRPLAAVVLEAVGVVAWFDLVLQPVVEPGMELPAVGAGGDARVTPFLPVEEFRLGLAFGPGLLANRLSIDRDGEDVAGDVAVGVLDLEVAAVAIGALRPRHDPSLVSDAMKTL